MGHTTTRPATTPVKGGARDTIPGAASASLTAYLLSQGVPPELAVLAGSVAMGLLSFLRKMAMDRLATG